KSLLFSAEKARILDCLSIRERGKGFQADINAYGSGDRWQTLRFHFTGERGIPFASTALVDRECLDVPTYRAMIDHLDGAKLGEAHPVIMRDAKARLRKREGVIAVLTTKTGIARIFPGLTTPEKRFESQIDAYCHVLQDLRMHAFEGGALLFQDRKGFLLLIKRERFPLLLPSITAFFQQMII